MKVGLIDVDGHNFPNIPLMKISAYHKRIGDEVEWYHPFKAYLEPYDTVYMSKVFSFTEDYDHPVYARNVIKGGSGYHISVVDGREEYADEEPLPDEIEHIYPDYSIYPEETKDTAFGFLTRGCPRGCSFCHVKTKEGTVSRKVADLKEFWNGQHNIVLCDPNILACKEWEDLLGQLIDSGACVDFNQGLDIRLMTEDKAEMLNKIKMKELHFAWDRYQDKDIILPKFKRFREISNIRQKDLVVYVLCGYDTTVVQDLERIYALREMGYAPYVMIYDKGHLPKDSELTKIQRWVNNRFVFWEVERYEDYKKKA